MSKVMTLMNELIELISMGPFGSDIKVDNFVNEGVPVLNGSNVSSVKLIEKSFKYVTPEKAKGLKKANAKRGDIVITHRGTVGQISYIPEDSLYDNYVISQSQFRVSLKTNLVDPIYFTYYFHTNEGQKKLLSFKSHVGVPALAQATTNFRLLEFPLIELKKQKEIAKVISDLDAKIELNNKINDNLELMAKTLYDYWFVQFDFPDADGKPYRTSGGKMVWNAELKREIPEGWEVKTIGNVTDVKAGGDKPKDYSVNKTETYSIPIYSNGITNEGLYGFTNKAKINKQSLTVSARGTIGYCVLRNKPFVPIIRLIVITPNSSYEVKYFYEFIKNLEFENSGSVQQQLTVPQISSLNIILPPPEILKKYDLLTSSGIDKIEINKEENQELASLRDWLLPMLMNGQVTVKD